MRPSRNHRPGLAAALASVSLLLSGCSVLAPLQVWGIVKGADLAGTTALAYGPSKAIDTVHHGDAPLHSVCIEYNRLAQLEDLVPSLQLELREQGVSSRVYESGSGLQECAVWLRYAATIEWGVPPLGGVYRAYLSSAALSLHSANGSLMSTSAYAIDADTGAGKWSSTRRKLAPVVKAVITGFSS